MTKTLKWVKITAQATENHTNIKLKSILKWLKAGHEVRVDITGKADRSKQILSLCNHIEKETRSGSRSLQKIIKPDKIRFTLSPTEGASNLVVDDLPKCDYLESLSSHDKDLLSDELEKELEQSIQDQMKKNKKP